MNTIKITNLFSFILKRMLVILIDTNNDYSYFQGHAHNYDNWRALLGNSQYQNNFIPIPL